MEVFDVELALSIKLRELCLQVFFHLSPDIIRLLGWNEAVRR